VLLPLLNQQAGWLTPTVAMVVVYVLSSFAATMLCEAMQRIPGNFTFEHR
jgi:amino acid permease